MKISYNVDHFPEHSPPRSSQETRVSLPVPDVSGKNEGDFDGRLHFPIVILGLLSSHDKRN